MSRRVALALLAGLAAGSVVVVAAAPPPTAPTAPKGKAAAKDELKLSADEQAVVDLTNKERKAENLPPLKPNAKLFKAARAHSANMAKQGKLDHVLDDKTPADRVKAAGYKYRATGENVAWNQRSPEAVLEAWMKSPGHRKNILTEEFTEIGAAVVPNEAGEPYWTQVFGTPLK